MDSCELTNILTLGHPARQFIVRTLGSRYRLLQAGQQFTNSISNKSTFTIMCYAATCCHIMFVINFEFPHLKSNYCYAHYHHHRYLYRTFHLILRKMSREGGKERVWLW